MSRNLTVLLSVALLVVGFNLPTAFSTVQPELTKKERKFIKRTAKKQGKKQARKYVDNKLLLIDTDEIANEAVTTPKIEMGAVTASEIADNAVSKVQLDPSVRPGGTLPAGVTLRGVIGPHIFLSGDLLSINQPIGVGHAVSFGGHRLPMRPAVHVIGANSMPSQQCPGTVTIPEAAPGHLCLYLLTEFADVLQVIDPLSFESTVHGVNYTVDSGSTLTFGDGRVSTMGFTVSSVVENVNSLVLRGTWAVQT